jgi:hypothetical protein
MIDTEQLNKFIQAKPFRQFALETSGGNYVVVQSPAHIKLPPPGFDLINIYGTDGLVHYIVEGTILNAAVYGPEPSKDVLYPPGEEN